MENSALAAALGSKPSASTSGLSPMDKYGNLLSDYSSEKLGTFIVPTEDGNIIRLYDNQEPDTKDPQAYIVLMTQYIGHQGAHSESSRMYRNTVIHKGTVRLFKALLEEWRVEGKVPGVVCHVEFKESDISDDSAWDTLQQRGKLSVKRIPTDDGSEGEPLRYGGEIAYMFQYWMPEEDYSMKNCAALNSRITEDDDDKAARVEAYKAEADARKAAAAEAVEQA